MNKSKKKIVLESESNIESGTMVPEGNYVCEQCSKPITVKKDGSKLPNCKNCGHTYFTKF